MGSEDSSQLIAGRESSIKRILLIALTACTFLLPALFVFARTTDGLGEQAAARRAQRRKQSLARRRQARRQRRANAVRQDRRDASAQPAEEIADPEEYRLGDPRANRPRVRRPPPRKPIPDIRTP